MAVPIESYGPATPALEDTYLHERILILAPFGRDWMLAQKILTDAGIAERTRRRTQAPIHYRVAPAYSYAYAPVRHDAAPAAFLPASRLPA